MANWTGSSRNDTKNGSSRSDRLEGRSGNDRLFGRDGDDSLNGGSGNDLLDGGTGIDTAVFSGRRADYQITTSNGVTTVRDLRRGSPDGTDTLTDIERLVFSDGVLDLRPNTQPTISAIDGITVTEDHARQTIDLLKGASDADGDALNVVSGSVKATSSNAERPVAVTVNGNSVAIDPAQFNDLAAGQQETVTVTYTITDGRGAPVTNTATLTVTGAAEAPAAPAPSGITWTGSRRGDTRSGTAGDDSLSGQAGNDKLSGLGGDDILAGGAGYDLLNGGDGYDTAVFAGNRADFRITTVGGVTFVRDLRRGGPEGTDTLVSVERLVFADGTVDLVAPPQPANRLPTISAITDTFTEDDGRQTFDLLTGAADADGDAMSVVAGSVSAASTNPDRSVTFTVDGNSLSLDPAQFNDLAAGREETVTVTYTITDGRGAPVTNTVTLTVTGASDGGVQPAATLDELEAVVASDGEDTAVFTGAGAVGSQDAPFVLKAGVENLTVQQSNAVNVRANSLNNKIDLGTAAKAAVNIDLADGGADTISGSAAALANANITGFGSDDRFVITGTDASKVEIVGVRNGSAILDIDTDGNGTIDASVHLEGAGLDGSKLQPNDFSVTSTDGGSAFAFAPTNEAPVATGGDASGDEGTTITGQVGGTDVDGDDLTYRLVAEVEGLTFNTDGSYSYAAPKDGGPVSFEYVAHDGELDSAPVTVTIGVAEVNEAPVATGGDASGDEGTTITGRVGGTDVDGDDLTYRLVAEVEGLTFNTDGSYSYAAPKDGGPVSFAYVAHDGELDSAPVTVTIGVAEVNEAPVATGGDASGDEGTTITGRVGGTDADGDDLTYRLVAEVEGLTFSTDGSYSYAAPKDGGPVSFAYVAHDGELDSAPVTVTIGVAEVNEAPVATGGDASGDEGTTITGQVGGTDADGDDLTYRLVAEVEGLTFNTDGSYSYAAPKDGGPVSFEYVAYDGELDSAPVTVTIGVAEVNEAPVATGGDASGDEGTTITGQVGGTDVDGDDLTYRLVAEVEGLTFNTDGSYSYAAPKDGGPVSFAYVAHDGELDSAPVTVTIGVAEVNEAPVATGGDASGDEGTTITGRVGGTDVDGDDLTYRLVAEVEGLTFNTDGSYSYAAPKDGGPVSFAYVAHDGELDSAPMTVTIGVAEVNEAPVATGGDASGDEGTTITGRVGGTDVDGDDLTYRLVAEVEGLTFNTDGSYSYAAPKDGGPVSFAYVAHDGELDSAPVTVTIGVAEVNEAPVATGGDASGDEGTTITGRVGGTDADGDDLTYRLVAEVEGLTFSTDGIYSYAAPKDGGPVSFAYVAHDGELDSAPVTVTIGVAEVNEAPVATGGDASGDEGTTITGQVGGTDADGDDLTYRLVAEVEGLTFNTDGSYSYAAPKDGGPVSFEYVAYDGELDSAPVTVTIGVAEVNEAPVATGGDASGDEGTTITGRVGGTDADGDDLTYRLVAEVEGLTFNTDGSYSYAAPKDGGPVSFAYVAHDGELDSAPMTVTIGVAEVAEVPPVVALANATGPESDGRIEIPVSLSHASDQDVTLTYEAIIPAKTIAFDGLGIEHSAILAGHEGLRWTGISSSGDGAALTATTGGGTIQALAPGALSLAGLTVSTASTNQVVTIEALRGGVVVATQQVTLGNGGAQSSAVTLGSDFSGIDAVRIDGSADFYGNDYPVRIDDVVLSGTQMTGQVTILAGQTEGSISVPVSRDGTLSVRLTEAEGAALGDAVEASAAVTNDDPEPLPMISFVNFYTTDVHEGTIQEFEVTRDSRLDEALTVELESEFFGNQSVTFAPGEAKVWATFGKADDDAAEPNQPYEIKLASSPNYLPGATVSVGGMHIDNDGGTLNTAPTASSWTTYIQEADFTTYGGTYSLAAYGNDAEGDRLTYELVGEQPAHGTISFDPDLGAGALMFTPDAGYLDTLHQGQTYEFTYEFTVSDGEFTSAPKTGTVMIFGSGSAAPAEQPADTDQTITATTTATGFVGGTGNDTLFFDAVPTGSPQLLGGTVANAVISLGGSIVGTPHAGKAISNIENLTFANIAGPGGRTLTINGDAADNAITVARTVREININGGGGDDTIDFMGATNATSESHRSVLGGGTGNDTLTVRSAAIVDDRVASGASGDDTYILGGGRQDLRFGAEGGNDTIRYFNLTEDVLDLAAAGIDAGRVTVTQSGGNTVFTIDGTSTVTVEGVTGMQFGTHWTAQGTYAPPAGEEPLPGDEEPGGEPGVNVSNLNLNLSEDGTTDTTQVWLNSKPTSDVIITLGSDGGVLFSVGGAAPSATPKLTFTPENWNQRQTVTVTAIDDAEYEPGDGTMVYFEPISTQDPIYQDVYPPSGWATIADNEAEPEVAAPEAQSMSADVWEDDPVAELQGNGYSASVNGIVEYMIVSQPVEGGTVTMIDDRTFRFEGDTEFLSSLNRGEKKAVTFEYAVSDGEVWSAPVTMTFNVHGFTNGADETYHAFTRSTPSQVDFLDLNGGDGNDTVVFDSITVTSGEDVSVGLDQAFHWTEYAGKSIINTENITIRDTNGDTTRTMTVSGNSQANVITIENTDHKLTILGLGGDDVVNFKGTGNGLKSVINGGAGDDTVNAYSAAIVNVGAGNDTVNVFGGSNVTIQNFTAGDRINFAAGIEAGNVSSAVQGTDTVFTVNQNGITSTVTVKGATNLVSGTDWTTGTAAELLPVEPAVVNAQSVSAEVVEGGIAIFTFTRSGDLSQPLTVNVDTSVGTAVPGTDFTAPSTIVFAAGSDTAILEVQTLTDAVAEEAATIEVRLVPGAGYVIGAADGNVTDLIDAPETGPEPAVLPSLSIDDVTVNENAGTASFTVTLSSAATAPVSVEYATAPASGPAGSFQPASGTLTFAPGETTKTIDVPLNDNTTVATGAQKFVVTLSNASGATLADLSGEGTILDDDMPAEMPALVIETTAALNEFSTISWNAIPGAASYVLIGVEPDEPNFTPHTLGFAVAPNTSLAINGNDEFAGMVVTVEARDAEGNVLARSENRTDLIANVNDVPTGRPVVSDNSPDVGQLLTISIGDLEDGDGMRADRPDEFGYLWQRSTDGGATWNLVGSGDAYSVTQADAGYLLRGAAQYADRGDTLETVYSLTTAAVGDPNPNTPPVAFDDTATTSVGEAVTIDVLANDFDFENDIKSIATHGQPANGSVIVENGLFVYTPRADFVGTDTFEYTLNGGDTARVSVTVEQPDAAPFTLLTVDALDENSTLSWTAVPGAVSYVLIGTEPDDPTAPPHELGFALAPATSFAIGGDDEFAGMAIHVEARDATGKVITRSLNETGPIANINDIPTGNLGLDDMTPEVGQVLMLDYGTFEDGDGYRDRGRVEEFEWAVERSSDGVTWTTITTGPSAGRDGPFGFSYTVTQADMGQFLRGRAIYEDRAGDTIETVYSLTTSRVGAAGTGGTGGGTGDGGAGDDGGAGEIVLGSLIITQTDGLTEVTEGGAGDTFTVALADQPTSDVSVDVFSSNGHSWAFGPDGSMTLLFTPDNWNEPQTVTVTADDDFVREPTELDGQYLYTTSLDRRYDGLMPELPVTVHDGPGEPDPIPYVGVGVAGNGVVTEGGEIVFNFMRREGVNTDPLEIVVKMEGLDASDIEKILWNGSETGVKGFKAGFATATMTVVLADNALVDGDRYLDVTVQATEAYFDDFDNIATAMVLDNDVAGEEPVNQAPVAGNITVELTEDDLFAQIAPNVTDPEDDPITILPVGELPSGVTFDAASQWFVFNGDPAAFDALDTDEKATIEFQYVANDGSMDSAPGTITININGITDQAAPQIDPEPVQYADPYNYDLDNGDPAKQPTAGNDILNDFAGLSSTIQGYGGDDTIYGRDLNDLLVGGYGSDTIHGGSGDDTLNGDGGGANVRNVGTAGADWLYGGDGTDTINGQDGDDIIVGGHGADNLNGGLGNDTFVFFDIFDRGDTITMQGQAVADVFDFRSFDFGPNELGTQGARGGLRFFNEAPVEGQMLEDAFYYNSETGRLSLDTGTDGLEDFHVTLLVGTQGVKLNEINAEDFLA